MICGDNSSLRIGYVGQLDKGGTCYSRLLPLEAAEPGVCTLDIQTTLPSRGVSRFERLLEHLPGGGVRSRALNAQLLELVAAKQLNVLWLDKGDWVAPSTLAHLRRRGVILIHHLTDALWPRKWQLWLTRWRLRAGARHYNFYLTSNEVDARRLAGIVQGRVLLTQLGFDDRRFNGRPVVGAGASSKWANDVLFIGHREPRTQQYLETLLREGLPVRVYGAGWQALAERSALWREHAFGPVGDEEYVLMLKGAKIGLCFVSEWNYNQTSARSYEIPACGTFLLAMRTDTHRSHFEEGVEAEFFASPEELVRKAKHYLRDAEVRHQVAARGRERCEKSGYSWREIMEKDWAIVKAELCNLTRSKP